MAVVTKGVDNSAPPYHRGVVFTSTTDFGATDTIDINGSIGGPAVQLVFETSAGSSCTFKLNSMFVRYPLLTTAKSLGYPAPDLQNGLTRWNSEAISTTLGPGEVWSPSIPVSNIEFTAFSGTVTVSVRA
jgi:hypothetical protein